MIWRRLCSIDDLGNIRYEVTEIGVLLFFNQHLQKYLGDHGLSLYAAGFDRRQLIYNTQYGKADIGIVGRVIPGLSDRAHLVNNEIDPDRPQDRAISGIRRPQMLLKKIQEFVFMRSVHPKKDRIAGGIICLMKGGEERITRDHHGVGGGVTLSMNGDQLDQAK